MTLHRVTTAIVAALMFMLGMGAGHYKGLALLILTAAVLVAVFSSIGIRREVTR